MKKSIIFLGFAIVFVVVLFGVHKKNQYLNGFSEDNETALHCSEMRSAQYYEDISFYMDMTKTISNK
ncbi:MAG: hypothetical protein ACI94Y_001488 [Maribacter sp.]|jgi:hypothetical protein